MRVTKASKDQSGVTLSCRSDHEVPVRIDVVFNDVIRVRAGSARAFDLEREQFILEAREHKTVLFKMANRKNEIDIVTSKLTVRITKKPFAISYIEKGQVLTSSHGAGLRVLKSKEEVFGEDECEWRKPLAHDSGRVFQGLRRYQRDHVFGFGERFNFVEGSKRVITMWVDHNFRNPEYHTFEDGRHMARDESTYSPVPLMLNSRGYGVFLNTTWKSTWRTGTEDENEISFETDDPMLDYFFMAGGFRQILGRYTDITGRSPLPPRWAFGYWQSKDDYASRKEVLGIASKLRKKKIPCDVVTIDWLWHTAHCSYEWSKPFPDPKGMMGKMMGQHIRTCLWEGSFFEWWEIDPKDLRRKGYCVPYQDGWYIDFTNPGAVKWFQGVQQRLVDEGASVFKTDFGELVGEKTKFSNGKIGKEMHNAYTLLYRKSVYDVVSKKDTGGIIFARSGYAGTQRYPVTWAGDQNAIWEDLRAVIKAGISIGLSGFPFWASDIGGYVGTPTPELFVRWTQFGAFSPIMQAHGGQDAREPWVFGKKAEKIIVDFIKLRYRLMPYIYSSAKQSSKTGLPMMRALALDYPDDHECRHIEDEYMFGESLLVAPVTRNAEGRDVYLPEGKWFDYWTNREYKGGQWIAYKAALKKLPLFIKAGAIIPYGPEVEYLDDENERIVRIDVYRGARTGSFPLYLGGKAQSISYKVRSGKPVTKLPAGIEGADIRTIG